MILADETCWMRPMSVPILWKKNLPVHSGAKDNPNRFVFYEAYTDDDAVAHHKTTAHYKVHS